MENGTIALIDNAEALASLVGRIGKGDVCAIDTEADSLHRYRESLCLIQFAHGDDSVLVDPLAIEDLTSLSDAISESTVWMHGADYDMTMMRREFGVLPKTVFDTQIGARLLGVRKFGLANLVEHYFGVVLSKTSQKADWGQRPLKQKMMEYALNDVRYLLPMADMIVSGLHEKGRYDWFVESCEAARAKVLERDDSRNDPWRVQGAGRLDRKGLNYLRALWNWRDAEAESWDRPSFMVLTNRQMVNWSLSLTSGKKLEIPANYRPERRRRLEKALAAAEQLPASEHPTKVKGLRRRRDSEFENRVNEMIAIRDKKAAELDIESSLIASRSMLECLAGEDGAEEGVLLGWQKACLGLD